MPDYAAAHQALGALADERQLAIATLETRLEILSGEKADLQRRMSDASERITVLETQLHVAQIAASDANAFVAENAGKLDEAHNALSRLETRQLAQQRAIDAAKQQARSERNAAQATSLALVKAEAEIRRLEAKLEEQGASAAPPASTAELHLSFQMPVSCASTVSAQSRRQKPNRSKQRPNKPAPRILLRSRLRRLTTQPLHPCAKPWCRAHAVPQPLPHNHHLATHTQRNHHTGQRHMGSAKAALIIIGADGEIECAEALQVQPAHGFHDDQPARGTHAPFPASLRNAHHGAMAITIDAEKCGNNVVPDF